jgi:hypothetical protein
MLDLFQSAHWSEISDFLTSGDPPLITQLLVLNTLVFLLWILRRVRGAPAMDPNVAISVQALLLFSNALILFEKPLFELLG